MTTQPALSEHEQELVAAAAEFAATEVTPHAAAWETSRSLPRSTFERAAQAGFAHLIVPPPLGGEGISTLALARFLETLAASDFAFAFSLIVHNNLAGNIARNGTFEQQRRHLPAMRRGDVLGAFLLTEPTAGSDAAHIKATALPTATGWTLRGEKAWITNASSADLLSVYATVDPAAGGRGIACFLVEADRAGVTRTPAYEMLGAHALGTGGFVFEDVELTAADLLLPPGSAYKEALAGIDLARVTVAAMCCGMVSNALDVALQHTAGRSAFGQRVADFQGIQWQLADVATDLAAARALTYEAASSFGQEGGSLLAAHAKKFSTRVALARIADCLQTMGAIGLRQDTSALARHLACAKIAQFLDGTTEIQNVVIARALFKDVAPA